MLRKLVVGLVLAAALALPLANTAEAAIADGVAASHIASQLLPVENAQFVWGGRQYCWYANGWRGPGFYWCGYAWNSGLGWGGGYGWNGWGGGAGWAGGVWGGGGLDGGGGARGGGGGRRRGARRRLARRRGRLARRRLSRRRWRLSWRRWSHAPLNRPDQVLARYR